MGVQSGYVTSCIQENIILWLGREEKIGAFGSSLPAADDQAASRGAGIVVIIPASGRSPA
jgi:hypothetical protein